MTDTATLTDAVGNALLPFDVEDKRFYIRQPAHDEYDEAMSMQRLVYQKKLHEAYIQDVADVPCSEGERLLFQAMVDDTEKRFQEAPDGPQKRVLADELANLQNQMQGRTLAEETAADTAALKRDRWLCARLLCHEDGTPYFDPHAKDFAQRWNKLPIRVKNEARSTIWQALALVREAPFLSDL